MRIVCPSCNAAYEVPDGQLREGRVVRCARCGTDWAPVATAQVPDAGVADEFEVERTEPHPPASEPVHKTMALEDEAPAVPLPAAPAKPPPARQRRLLLVAAWVVSLLAVGAGIAGLVIGREHVMAAWAPSIRAYAALGLAGR